MRKKGEADLHEARLAEQLVLVEDEAAVVGRGGRAVVPGVEVDAVEQGPGQEVPDVAVREEAGAEGLLLVAVLGGRVHEQRQHAAREVEVDEAHHAVHHRGQHGQEHRVNDQVLQRRLDVLLARVALRPLLVPDRPDHFKRQANTHAVDSQAWSQWLHSQTGPL